MIPPRCPHPLLGDGDELLWGLRGWLLGRGQPRARGSSLGAQERRADPADPPHPFGTPSPWPPACFWAGSCLVPMLLSPLPRRHGELRGQRGAAERVPRRGGRHPSAPHRQLPPAPGHLVPRREEDFPQQPHVSSPCGTPKSRYPLPSISQYPPSIGGGCPFRAQQPSRAPCTKTQGGTW